MPFLSEIVTAINKNWQDKLPFKNARWHCIAEQIMDVHFAHNEKDETVPTFLRFPAEINASGEAKKIDIDSSYQLIVFHKIESIQNGAKRGQFGDGVSDLFEIANMSLVVFGSRTKAQMPSHQIEARLKDALPDNLKLTVDGTIQNSSLKLGNSLFDKMALINREYSDVEIELTNLIAFELKYRIESSWKKGCFNKCC